LLYRQKPHPKPFHISGLVKKPVNHAPAKVACLSG